MYVCTCVHMLTKIHLCLNSETLKTGDVCTCVHMLTKVHLCLNSETLKTGERADSVVRSKRSGLTYLRLVVSLSKTLHSPKVLVIPRKRWRRPDLTDKKC